MTIRALHEGKWMTFASVDELMAWCTERSQARNPERYAPDGTPLLGYDGTCRHDQLERTDGRCGDRWQHRLMAWQRAQEAEEIHEDSESDLETRGEGGRVGSSRESDGSATQHRGEKNRADASRVPS